MTQPNPTQQTASATRVWDLPLRLFHWSLLATVVALFVTAKIGGDAMKWHFYCGYLALTLLMFRVVWGFMGSRYARFASFPPNPVAAWRVFRGQLKHGLGHDPMGALSVYALLFSLGFQAVSGLFSNDDIAAEGPLAVKVSRALSDQITGLHKINQKIMIALVLTHIAAIVYHHFVKKHNLITAMVTGDQANALGEPAQDDGTLRLRALSLLALCGVAVWWVVNKL